MVSWSDAVAFCRWLSEWQRVLGPPLEELAGSSEIRLPTEWEWEQAATGGTRSNVYPWGSEWHESRANTALSDLNRTTAVGMYPHGAGFNGAHDLTGNVFEWCLNESLKVKRTDLGSNARRVVRGGSAFDDFGVRGNVRGGARYGYDPWYRSPSIGFRLTLHAR
jgi:formylglycine-generating enzyme required for sulfatase activity